MLNPTLRIDPFILQKTYNILNINMDSEIQVEQRIPHLENGCEHLGGGQLIVSSVHSVQA